MTHTQKLEWMTEYADRNGARMECVAVLGRGKKAEAQLFEWLRWFDDNGFAIEHGTHTSDPHTLAFLMGNRRYCRMVRTEDR